jgi:hypothetical protein
MLAGGAASRLKFIVLQQAAELVITGDQIQIRLKS